MRSLVKKATAFFLCIVMLGLLGSSLVSANALSPSDAYLNSQNDFPTLRENLIHYSCRYDEENAKVFISGTVNHDIMIQHREYFLDVYMIAPDQTVKDAVFGPNAQYKASIDIAIKFDISLSAPTMTERFSRYAIILRSEEGEKILGAEPQYVHITASYTYDPTDHTTYKGISSQLTSLSGTVGAGTAIVPVYLNRLLSNNTGGMIYPLEDGFCYFDHSYVEQLDAKTRTYSASGTKVYFQFLLEANGSTLALANGQMVGAAYDLPDLRRKENLQKIAAASEFLSERYDAKQNGVLSGLILGSSIDQWKKSYTGGLSLEEYAEQYAFYLLVASNSARMKRPELDVILPFSAVNTYSESTTVKQENYSPSALLEEILEILNERLAEPFSCGTMIESALVPMNLADEDTPPALSDKKDLLSAENLHLYETYLKQLQEINSSAPTHFVYRWMLPNDLLENRLACAYVYSYYQLLRHEKISSFVVSFSEEEQNGALLDLSQILRYIDTSKGEEITRPLLQYFGKNSWSEVLALESFSPPAVRKMYRIQPTSASSVAYKGFFEYFHFSSGNVSDWYAGVSCRKIRSDLLNDGTRGVRGIMSSNRKGAPSEMLCLYEFSENLVYTPYLKLTVQVTDDMKSEETLYEVTVSLGNHQTTVLAEQMVSSGERCELWLDLSALSAEDFMTEYIKVGADMVEGEAEEFSLWMIGMTGYSEQYTSEELSKLIEAERMLIRNQDTNEEKEDSVITLLWVIFGVLLLVSSLVVGVFLFFQRKDEKRSDEDEEKRQKNLRDDE